jgi:mRNA interferase MazF
MPYLQRDLLLVPVPFSDLTSHKIRPVVVLSNDRYNADEADLLVVGVTSNPLPRPYTIPLDTAQLDEGTMRRPSLVRADKGFQHRPADCAGSFRACEGGHLQPDPPSD